MQNLFWWTDLIGSPFFSKKVIFFVCYSAFLTMLVFNQIRVSHFCFVCYSDTLTH